MLDNREIKKEAIIVVATFYFTMIFSQYNLFDTVENFTEERWGNSDFAFIMFFVLILFLIPIILFTFMFFIIILITMCVDWLKRNFGFP